MTVKVIDIIQRTHETLKREVIHNTSKMHTWIHVYAHTGDIDDMHCTNEDQNFYVIEGECTMHFPGGDKAVMKPGMIALIHAGDFYQLENTGDSPMILLANRSGPHGATTHINYDLQKDIKELSAEELTRIRDSGRTPSRGA